MIVLYPTPRGGQAMALAPGVRRLLQLLSLLCLNLDVEGAKSTHLPPPLNPLGRTVITCTTPDQGTTFTFTT